MKRRIYLTILFILISLLFAGCFRSSSRPPADKIPIVVEPDHDHEEDLNDEFWLEPLAEPGAPWYKADLHIFME